MEPVDVDDLASSRALRVNFRHHFDRHRLGGVESSLSSLSMLKDCDTLSTERLRSSELSGGPSLPRAVSSFFFGSYLEKLPEETLLELSTST